MVYNRIRQEINAYNDIAKQNLGRQIEGVTSALVGKDLIASFRQGAAAEGFPNPPSLWIDSRASPVSQLEAYRWLSPIRGTCFLQLGGSGSHAIKAIIGGVGQSWLLTPMVSEIVLARRMAKHLGVVNRLNVVQGIGEQLPFPDASIDGIYGGGTLHHLQLGAGLKEIARVLKPGGRAAFTDPSLNFIYKILEFTRIRNLGREPGAQCYPLRIDEIYDSASGFRTAKCLLSGGPIRYAIVGATRIFKLPVPVSLSLTVQSIETKILLKLRLHSMLGGLAVLLER